MHSTSRANVRNIALVITLTLVFYMQELLIPECNSVEGAITGSGAEGVSLSKFLVENGKRANCNERIPF